MRCMLNKIGERHSALVLFDKVNEVHHYRCPDCGTLQESIKGRDGVTRWRFSPYNWNIALAKRLSGSYLNKGE